MLHSVLVFTDITFLKRNFKSGGFIEKSKYNPNSLGTNNRPDRYESEFEQFRFSMSSCLMILSCLLNAKHYFK